MEAQVLAAIVSATVALVIAGARELFDSRRRSGQERRETEIGYLRPLRNASRDFLRRLEDIRARLIRGEVLNDEFQELRSLAQTKDGRRFHAECNDARTWHGSTLHVTARYLGSCAMIRTQLPLSRIDAETNRALEEHIDAVQKALGGEYGLWAESQDAIGQLVVQNELLSYRDFLLRLVEDFHSYKRLFDFYSGIGDKRESELARTIEALKQLVALLEDILLSPARRPRRLK